MLTIPGTEVVNQQRAPQDLRCHLGKTCIAGNPPTHGSLTSGLIWIFTSSMFYLFTRICLHSWMTTLYNHYHLFVRWTTTTVSETVSICFYPQALTRYSTFKTSTFHGMATAPLRAPWARKEAGTQQVARRFRPARCLCGGRLPNNSWHGPWR